MTQNKIKIPLFWIVVLTVLIFLLEIITPQGVGEAILYVGVILVGLSSRNYKIIYLTVAISIFLTMAGYFISPTSAEPWKSVTNRFFAIVVFIILAFVGIKRIQVEEILHKSEERYRRLLDNMMEGAQIIGFDWRYLYVNDKVALQGRETKDKLIGRTMMEAYPGIENTHLFSVLKNCMEERTSYQMENKFIYPDGSTGWFELSIQPIEEGLFILSNDITKRKNAEAQLYELNMDLEQRVLERTHSLASSLKLTSALYEVTQSVINFSNLTDVLQSIVHTVSRTLSADRATLIIINHQEQRITHLVKAGPGAQNIIDNVPYSELMEGLSGWAIRELKPAVSPKDMPDPREGLQAQIRRRETNCGCIVVLPLHYQEEAFGTMTVINRPDQPNFTAEEVNWLEAIAAQAAIAIGRAQTYEKLHQSEEMFRLASLATKDAIWDWQLNTNHIQWSVGLQKVFHYPPESVETNHEWRLERIHPEDKTKVIQSLQNILDNNLDFWSKEYRFERMDKTYADVIDRAYVLRNEMGKPHRMIGAMRDITQQKQSEHALREFNRRLSATLAEIEQRNQEISLLNKMFSHLHQIALDLLKLEDTNQLLDKLVKSSALFLDASYAEFMLAEDDTLVVRAATQNSLYLIGQRMKRTEAVLSWQAFDTRQPITLNDYSTWTHRKEIYKEFELHAAAAFPILNNETCIGVLGLARNQPNYEFTSDQIKLGGLFASLAALIIANTQLRESLKQQSIRDPLTGLFNRRYMEEMLKREVSRATRRLHPLGIVMLDIDHFKRINDTFGHSAGDKVLREVGRFLQSQIRGEDIPCRYGGEEFLLILPDVDLESIKKRAEQIRHEIQNIQIENVPPITLSLGVAVYPQHGDKINAVIEAADAALYRAKQNGRNRVEVADGSVH